MEGAFEKMTPFTTFTEFYLFLYYSCWKCFLSYCKQFNIQRITKILQSSINCSIDINKGALLLNMV